MKRILLIFALMLASAVGVNAQVVLNIMSPSSIQGGLTHSNNGDATGWGLADLLNPADAVLDTVVVMDDSTAGVNTLVGLDPGPTTGNPYPGIPLKYEGCNLDTTSAWQTNRLAGKIVLIARGTCEFGKKVYLAERAGARAVILYNRDNEVIGAGSGVFGPLATIPFAMISRADGDMLRLAIEGGQTVVAFLGNKIGAFPNDMSISPAEAMYPPALAVPALLAQDTSDFKMKLGFWARNDGSANQSNVIANVTVKRGGTTLYTMSTSSFSMNAGDSSYISFPPFQLNSYPLGAYDVNYNVAIANETFPLDNSIDFAAVINDSLFSYASVDATTLMPKDNNSIKSSSFTSSWATGIHFRHPQASRMLLKGVRFACFTSAPDSLNGRSIDVAVDEWLDSFTDLADTNCQVTNTSPLAVETYTYTSNAQDSMVTQLFDDPIELDDNMRYIISLNTSDQSIFMNHSYGPAYQLNDVTAGEQPRELIRVDNSWFTGGFSSGRIPTFQLIMEQSFIGVPEELIVDALVYPNPSRHLVYLKLNGFEPAAGISVYDMTGAVVLQKAQASVVNGEMVIDVSSLPSGAYVVVAPGVNGDLRANLVVSH
jgi:hypothetical protein